VVRGPRSVAVVEAVRGGPCGPQVRGGPAQVAGGPVSGPGIQVVVPVPWRSAVRGPWSVVVRVRVQVRGGRRSAVGNGGSVAVRVVRGPASAVRRSAGGPGGLASCVASCVVHRIVYVCRRVYQSRGTICWLSPRSDNSSPVLRFFVALHNLRVVRAFYYVCACGCFTSEGGDICAYVCV
jgi:hypothetical protein